MTVENDRYESIAKPVVGCIGHFKGSIFLSVSILYHVLKMSGVHLHLQVWKKMLLFNFAEWYSLLQIMYLGAATNNKASTALDFFLEAVQKYGFPLR